MSGGTTRGIFDLKLKARQKPTGVDRKRRRKGGGGQFVQRETKRTVVGRKTTMHTLKDKGGRAHAVRRGPMSTAFERAEEEHPKKPGGGHPAARKK